MSEQNKRVVMFYVDAFNRGDLDAVRAMFAPDALIHGALGWGGLETAVPIWEQLMRCFQLSLEVDAVAAEGDAGVYRLLEILEQEVAVAMALAGARSLAELNRSFLHFGAPLVTAPHVHSAFPLLFPTPEAPR